MGLTPHQVYECTPFEISLIAKNKSHTNEIETERLIAHAWHIEALARCKKLPKLNKLIKSIKQGNSNVASKGDYILRAMAERKGIKL